MYQEGSQLAHPSVEPAIPEKLKLKKQRLEKELVEVEKAIALFNKHPEMAEAFTLVRNIY